MKKTRLKKLSFEGGGGNPAGGSFPMPILLNGPMERVDNKDEINQITYGPSISREWQFDKLIDNNAEWSLRSSKRKRLKNKFL